MGPMNSVWTVNFVSCTVNPCDVTIHALKKKKKKKREKKARKCILVNANAQSKPHHNGKEEFKH